MQVIRSKVTFFAANHLSDACESKHSQKLLLDKSQEIADDREEFEDGGDSEEEIDTRVTKTAGDTSYHGVRKNTGNISNFKKIKGRQYSKGLSDDVTPTEISNNKDDIERREFQIHDSTSSDLSFRKVSSKKKNFSIKSMDRNIESLEIKHESEESSVLNTPTPMTKEPSNVISDSTEESHLLQPLRPMSTSTGYGATSDQQEHEDFDQSMFRGALDVHVLDTPWESDINRVVDVQTGEAEWETKINPLEGGLCVDGWESNIIKMSTEADKFGLDIWDTAIHELPKDMQLHNEWDTKIARKMTNDDNPDDWSSKFNSIEKVEQSKNIWTTMVRKIQNRNEGTEQWKTTFNAIGTETDKRKTGWKLKISKRLRNLSLKTDWSTRINRIERSVEGEIWKNRFSKILLQCDDRESNWNTKFYAIQENEVDLNPWNTSFREIALRDTGQPEIWSTTFYSISEERDLPQHWNTIFTSIEQPDEGNDWSVTIEDVPDNFRQPSDWTTGFNAIENHEKNILWDTTFNSITKVHASERTWTSNFLQADISDISRRMWETNFSRIEKADIIWEVSVNPIINHPTNNPIDKG